MDKVVLVRHESVFYRPEGESRHTIPAEVCRACSDFEQGILIPVSFCEQAKARLESLPWERR